MPSIVLDDERVGADSGSRTAQHSQGALECEGYQPAERQPCNARVHVWYFWPAQGSCSFTRQHPVPSGTVSQFPRGAHLPINYFMWFRSHLIFLPSHWELSENNQAFLTCTTHNFRVCLTHTVKVMNWQGTVAQRCPCLFTMCPALLAFSTYTHWSTWHVLSHSMGQCFPVQVSPGQRILSMLPLWHIYERTVQYHVLSRAACVIYSSVTHFKRDLASYKPHFLCCVPLLLDRLHARVLASLSKLPPVKSTIAQLLVMISIAHTKVRPTS